MLRYDWTRDRCVAQVCVVLEGIKGLDVLDSCGVGVMRFDRCF